MNIGSKRIVKTRQ